MSDMDHVNGEIAGHFGRIGANDEIAGHFGRSDCKDKAGPFGSSLR